MHTNYLVGQRVKLVKFTDRYITAQYLDWLNNSIVTRYMCTGRLPVSRDEVFAPTNDKDLLFAILSKLVYNESGTLVESDIYENYIGTISLHRINWIDRKGEIGYMIGSSNHWGIGIATEVVELITNYGFNRLNLNKITAGVVDGNIGSDRVLIKNGYKQYCTNPQEYYLDGKYLDMRHFYKLQEWR